MAASSVGDLIGGGPADPGAEGLVAHWPLDEIQGTKTPDIVNGYDMELANLTDGDVVDGKNGNAFSFDNARQTLLSRVHEADEDLPANNIENRDALPEDGVPALLGELDVPPDPALLDIDDEPGHPDARDS